jgi:hypothetical protein
MSIEAMKQALDALELGDAADPITVGETIDALRAVIEQAEKQEPLAWVCEGFGKAKHNIDYMQKDIDALPIGTMLYTALPQRELQELTDEQIDFACLSVRHDFWLLSVGVQDYIRFQAKEWAAALAKVRSE